MPTVNTNEIKVFFTREPLVREDSHAKRVNLTHSGKFPVRVTRTEPFWLLFGKVTATCYRFLVNRRTIPSKTMRALMIRLCFACWFVPLFAVHAEQMFPIAIED